MTLAQRILRSVSDHGSRSLRDLQKLRADKGEITSTADDLVADGKLRKEPGPSLRQTIYTPAEGHEHGTEEIDLDQFKQPKDRKHYTHQRPTSCIPRPRFLLIPGDMHYPVHDPWAIDAMIAFARDIGVDLTILQGDTFDFFSLSSYRQEAERVLGKGYTVHEEAESAKDLWPALLSMGPVRLIPGNHCYRLKRFVDENPGLHDHPSVDLANIIKAPPGVICHPWRSRIRIGSLCVEHGDHLKGSMTKYGAARVLESHPDQTTIYGHTHRINIHRATRFGGDAPRTHMAASIGHLSDVTKQTWVSDPNWQTGFALIEFWEEAGKTRFTPHIIEIIKGRFSFGGTLYGRSWQ